MWSSGEHVLVRNVLGRRVLSATPATVVETRPDVVVTWIAPGTPIVYPQGLDDGRLLPVDRWLIERRSWFGTGVLDLTPPGRAHMIRHFWHEDRSFRGWYVNLQAPLRPTAQGFDTTDHQLDLRIEPDGAVTWKDEDHLEQAVGYGMFSEDEAEAARAEARRVLAEWPFPTGWEAWRPDPAWPIPELPAGWDRPAGPERENAPAPALS
jgi:hypothetical protein